MPSIGAQQRSENGALKYSGINGRGDSFFSEERPNLMFGSEMERIIGRSSFSIVGEIGKRWNGWSNKRENISQSIWGVSLSLDLPIFVSSVLLG